VIKKLKKKLISLMNSLIIIKPCEKKNQNTSTPKPLNFFLQWKNYNYIVTINSKLYLHTK
jgi:hypothetical protein